MVGTPRSTGCQTCRTRKKKCDERRPACSECVKAGWRCPGYDKQWKFVDENKQVAKQYGRTEDSGVGSSSSTASEPGATPRGENRLELYQAEEMGDATSFIGIFWPLRSVTDKRAHVFISIVNNGKAQCLLPLKGFASFLPSVPARLGRNAALDAAVSCLCTIFVDYLTVGSTASPVITQKYIASLRALQQCIRDPTLRTQSETICASTLIQMCELTTTQNLECWGHLSRGCALLIKDCDPNRFASGFDKGMLDSQQHLFIAQAAFAGEDCFLAQPQWRRLMRAPTEPSVFGPGVTEVKPTLSVLLLEFAPIIRESTDMVTCDHAQHPGPGYQARLEELTGRLYALRHKMETWLAANFIEDEFQTDAEAEESTDNGCKVPRHEDPYPAIFRAAMCCAANAVLAKTDRMLLHLGSLLHQTVHLPPGLFNPDYMRAMEKRRTDALAILAFAKSRCHIASMPLEFGLKVIELNDNLFDVAVPPTSCEPGVEASALALVIASPASQVAASASVWQETSYGSQQMNNISTNEKQPL